MPNRLDGFNDQQKTAILFPHGKNVQLSAGAGSGKTKTLTERVYQIICEQGIKPSELLVITFTNNAAYEMKSRIIERFENGDPDLANQILSAQIQTFDSFCSYLISTYSNKLGIPSTVNILDDTLLESKIQETINDIFEEYYNDEKQCMKMVATLKKFTLKDDADFRQIITKIYKTFSKMEPKEVQHYLDLIGNKEYTKEFFDKSLHLLVEHYKSELKKTLIDLYIRDKYLRIKDSIINLSESEKEEIAKLDVNHLPFNGLFSEFYNAYIALLDLDDISFINACKSFKTDNGELLNKKGKEYYDDDLSKYIHDGFKKIINTEKALLSYFINTFDYQDELEHHLSFKEDIVLILDVINKLTNRIDEYKKESNAYTYTDIRLMALSLFNDAQTAKKISMKYRCILVDEYQDTDAIQEAVINNILNHGRASLFTVGDAKQSIYAFKGSEVSLFIDRGKTSDRIDMNMNYRSGKKLIKDMNYLFSNYLSLDKGEIDYSDTKEQLQYDDKVDLYSKPYEHFGVKRIISTSKSLDDGFKRTTWEINAIINDIKEKVGKGHTVSIRTKEGNEIREVKHKDFVILARTKKAFNKYVSSFARAGIPLNVIDSANLREIDAIIVVESLLNLINYFLGNIALSENKVRHYFISIIRSYLYEYKDGDIYHLLQGTLEGIEENEIYQDIKNFASRHKDEPASEMYISMLKHFLVVEKLYKIGDVETNISKLESINAIIKNQELAGGGIKDFVELFNIISKYQLEFKDETQTNFNNAVTLMTVHASKGLENKIVYLPASQNAMASHNEISFVLNKNLGLIFPYYSFSVDNKDKEGNIKEISIDTVLMKLADLDDTEDKKELSEHRRLYYVALTRAENTVYVVGDTDSTDWYDEDIFDIFESGIHYKKIGDKILAYALQEGIIDQVLLEQYQLLQKMVKYQPHISFKCDNKEIYSVYKAQFKTAIKELEDRYEDLCLTILKKIILYYDGKIELLSDDEKINILENMIDAGDVLAEISTFKEEEMKKESIIKSSSKICGYFMQAKDVLYTSYECDEFADECFAFDMNDKSSTEGAGNQVEIPNLKRCDVEEKEIVFEKRIKRRASAIRTADEDIDIENIINKGNELHKLLELVDLQTKDVSFIKNKKDQQTIANVLNNHLFDLVKGATIHKEYGYYDDLFDTTGFIDLLFIKGDEYYIVDYKTKDIEKDSYVLQLHAYQRNIERIFNITDPNKIHLYLLSIIDNKIKEIKPI